MLHIKFKYDYEKLPKGWENTKAFLVDMYPANLKRLRKELPHFVKRDTKIRGKQRYYGSLAKEVYILILIHLKTGVVFTTIREKNYKNFKKYSTHKGENFLLVKS